MIRIIFCLTVIIGLGFADEHGHEEECPQGQIFYPCGSPCNATCAEPFPTCAEVCVQRCQCPPGNVQLSESDPTCVPVEKCPDINCPDGHKYTICGLGCKPTCENLNPMCTKVCSPSCHCPVGMVQKAENDTTCVEKIDCKGPFLPSCDVESVFQQIQSCFNDQDNDLTCENASLIRLNCMRNLVLDCIEAGEMPSIFSMIPGGETVVANIKGYVENLTVESELTKAFVKYSCEYNPTISPNVSFVEMNFGLCESGSADMILHFFLKAMNRRYMVENRWTHCSTGKQLTKFAREILMQKCDFSSMGQEVESALNLIVYKLHWNLNKYIDERCKVAELSCPDRDDVDAGCHEFDAYMCQYLKWRYVAKAWIKKYHDWIVTCFDDIDIFNEFVEVHICHDEDDDDSITKTKSKTKDSKDDSKGSKSKSKSKSKDSKDDSKSESKSKSKDSKDDSKSESKSKSKDSKDDSKSESKSKSKDSKDDSKSESKSKSKDSASTAGSKSKSKSAESGDSYSDSFDSIGSKDQGDQYCYTTFVPNVYYVPSLAKEVKVKCSDESNILMHIDEKDEYANNIFWCADGNYANFREIFAQWNHEKKIYEQMMENYNELKDKCFIPDFSGQCGIFL